MEVPINPVEPTGSYGIDPRRTVAKSTGLVTYAKRNYTQPKLAACKAREN